METAGSMGVTVLTFQQNAQAGIGPVRVGDLDQALRDPAQPGRVQLPRGLTHHQPRRFPPTRGQLSWQPRHGPGRDQRLRQQAAPIPGISDQRPGNRIRGRRAQHRGRADPARRVPDVQPEQQAQPPGMRDRATSPGTVTGPGLTHQAQLTDP